MTPDNGIKLPEYIKIGGIRFKVIRDKMGDQGEIIFGKALIKISDELCQEKAEETTCHETVEGWNELYDLKLPHHKIQILGSALHQLSKDNDLSYMRK